MHPVRGTHFAMPVVLRLGLVVLLAAAGCAIRRPPATTSFDLHSLRLVISPDASGRLTFSDSAPLVGGIELSPLLAAEGIETAAASKISFQVLAHDGRFYLTAERFRAVWELTPVPGAGRAIIRPITVSPPGRPEGMTAPTLSRFGRDGIVCVRIDRRGEEPVFIDREGSIGASCG